MEKNYVDLIVDVDLLINYIEFDHVQRAHGRKEIQTIFCWRVSENCTKISEFQCEYAADIPQSLSTEIKSSIQPKIVWETRYSNYREKLVKTSESFLEYATYIPKSVRSEIKSDATLLYRPDLDHKSNT